MLRQVATRTRPAQGELTTWGERLRVAWREYPWGVITTFLIPALAFFAALTVYPILQTVYDSVHVVEPGVPVKFIGLRNYIELITADDTFRQAVINTVIWAVVAPVIDLAVGLLLALTLYSGIRGARFFRLAWFTPVLISYIVVGVLWTWIYNYDWGVVNGLLRAVGLSDLTQVWLGNPKTALWALILVDSWKWAGFHMVVCLAALHSLPPEVIEAAELDNCGWFAKLRFVMVPMIRSTLVALLILSFIGKMKIFDLVWITTRGGPLWSTETISTYVYKRAFDWNTFDLGYPSAVATVSFLAVITVVLLLTRLLRQHDVLEY